MKLFIFSFYSAFKESLKQNTWPPRGMPAVYKLLEKVQEEDDVNILFVCRSEDDFFTSFEKRKLSKLPNVNFYISPYKTINIKGLRNIIAQLNHSFVFLKLAFKKYEYAYCDREHVTYGAFLSLLKRKVVLRLHGVAGFNTKPLFKWKIFPNLKILAFKAPFNRIICSIDGSPGLNFIAKRCRNSTPYNLLYNGVDYKLPANAIQGFEEYKKAIQGPLLLSVGRLDKSKGIDLLIDSLNELRDSNWGCIIVGSGEESQALKNQVKQLALKDKIIFTGSLDRSKVYYCLGLADIFISLNKYGNQSNAVLEAMKSGKCILTYDTCTKTGRDSQFTKDEKLRDSLVLVDSEKDSDVTDKLSLLLSDPNLVTNKAFKVKKYSDEFILEWDERIEKEMQLLQS